MQRGRGLRTKLNDSLVSWSLVAGLHSCTSEREPARIIPASALSEHSVSQLADWEYQFTRARLDNALAKLDGHNDCLIPFEREGTVVGVKLYGVKPDSILGEAGIRNGDVILEVNGISAATSEGFLRISGEVHRESRLVVKLERDGKRLTLAYRITEQER